MDVTDLLRAFSSALPTCNPHPHTSLVPLSQPSRARQAAGLRPSRCQRGHWEPGTRLEGACGAAVEAPGLEAPRMMDQGPPPDSAQPGLPSFRLRTPGGALRSSSPQQPQQPESGWGGPWRSARAFVRSALCIRGWRAGPCERGPRRPQGARQPVLQLRQPSSESWRPEGENAQVQGPSAWITGSFCACSLCHESIKVGTREGLCRGASAASQDCGPRGQHVGPPVPEAFAVDL